MMRSGFLLHCTLHASADKFDCRRQKVNRFPVECDHKVSNLRIAGFLCEYSKVSIIISYHVVGEERGLKQYVKAVNAALKYERMYIGNPSAHHILSIFHHSHA